MKTDAPRARLVRGSKRLALVLRQGEIEQWENGVHRLTHYYAGPAQARRELGRMLAERRKEGWRVLEVPPAPAPPPPRKVERRDPFVEECDEVLATWRDGEYDDLKDAIQDARSLIPRARKRALTGRLARLEKMLAAAQRDLGKLVARDPSLRGYAAGLLPKTRSRAARRGA